MRNGLIHIYTGDGKGKTTAAVGISVRAKSAGLRILFAQFFKERDFSSEISLLRRIGIDVKIFDKVKSPFFNPDIDRAALRKEVQLALSRLQGIFEEDRYDLMVLDEFICLIAEDALSEASALSFLEKKPEHLELVLTGKGATERIMAAADYVTFMQRIKHPYQKNMDARKGIEF